MGIKLRSEAMTEELVQAIREFRDLGALLNKRSLESEEIPAELLDGLRKSIKTLKSLGAQNFGPIPDIDQIEKWMAWRKKESSRTPGITPIIPPGPWFGIPPAMEFHPSSTSLFVPRERLDLSTPIIDRGCNDPNHFNFSVGHGTGSNDPPDCPILFDEYNEYGRLSETQDPKTWGGNFGDLPNASWIVVDGSSTSTSLTGAFETEIPINFTGMFWLEVRSKAIRVGATQPARYYQVSRASIDVTHRCTTVLPVPPNPPFINVISDSRPLADMSWGSAVANPGFDLVHPNGTEILQNMAIRGPGIVRVHESINYLGRVEVGAEYNCAFLDGLYGVFECLEWTLRRRHSPVRQGVFEW